MTRKFRMSAAFSSRLGSLLLLFQRSPLVQMLFPEARVLGGAGLGEIAKWSVAVIAGLGAYDSVAGATTLTQLAPVPNSTAVPATSGVALSFVFQCTGTESKPKSWTVTGAIPNGLSHSNATNNTIDSITGIPTQTGSFPITVKAWEGSNGTGNVVSTSFTINVAAIDPAPEISIMQPAGSGLKDGKGKKSFGTATVGATGMIRKFTIKNTGSAHLTGLAVALDGAHAADFIVSAPAKSFLKPGASTNFNVTFMPSATGTRNAAIHVTSNDADENPFDIMLSGLGAAP